MGILAIPISNSLKKKKNGSNTISNNIDTSQTKDSIITPTNSSIKARKKMNLQLPISAIMSGIIYKFLCFKSAYKIRD